MHNDKYLNLQPCHAICKLQLFRVIMTMNISIINKIHVLSKNEGYIQFIIEFMNKHQHLHVVQQSQR